MSRRTSLLFGGALALRLALLVYGYLQDHYMSVKYTDVDYDVYTDAAREMAEGRSPFDRTTYRYTPVLAFLLLPNVYVHEICGKLLFVCCDLLVGVWLFHPFSINISTRGNADAIVVLLVMVILLLIMRQQVALAALAYVKLVNIIVDIFNLRVSCRYGAAVHIKIYPIIYALAFLVFLNGDYRAVNAKKTSAINLRLRLYNQMLEKLNQDRLVFGLTSGGFFIFLAAGCYYLYGYQFLYEAYLYHLTRTDNRHNFSVYFYDLYLRYNTPSGFGVGLVAFLPQLTSLIAISFAYGRDLPFALFALTMVFVIFNKVCTAQYFLWYTAFLPLIFPLTRLQLKWKGLGMIMAWLGGELHWLYWAYQLEMQGVNTFLLVWLAGLVFFLVNVAILAVLMHYHSFTPLFRSGHILQLVPCVRVKIN
ncbi:hypothetical protein CCR75_000042 [Bremia lactucae]|uniref:GPI mannosyltransferase 1 n=1 Tax=Bremia lactucae TaxID=4779 RepID=A0A976FIM5_BRELC|nr:hypothetical protein CCR75_000042 [Bremia lactucae]